MHQRLIASVVLASVLCATGCQKKSDTPPADENVQASGDSSAVAPPPLAGTWTIVASHMPDTSVMNETEAQAWIGRTLRLSATEVTSGDVRCSNPSFTRITMARDDLLGMDLNYPPGVLRRLADVDPLNLVNVSCDDAPLPALGRLIIEVDPDHILAPWEGVYFELSRTAR